MASDHSANAKHSATPRDTSKTTDESAEHDGMDPLRRSRTSTFWMVTAALVVLLVLLIIFIAQNTESTDVSFLSWRGTMPLSVAILIAAVAGLVVATTAGALRIWQLRRRIRRLERSRD